MQYTAIFHGCKNVNFQMKKYNIFLIFAQNIDCVYTCFRVKVSKNVYPCKSQFYYIKVGCREVFITRTCYPDVMIRHIENHHNPSSVVMVSTIIVLCVEILTQS